MAGVAGEGTASKLVLVGACLSPTGESRLCRSLESDMRFTRKPSIRVPVAGRPKLDLSGGASGANPTEVVLDASGEGDKAVPKRKWRK